jgi:hypothetical protein
MDEQGLPKSFLCPITGEIMLDPVMDPEGNSYERSAIEEWLGKSRTSPVTRTHLIASSLMPNRALKDAIQAYTCSKKADAKNTEASAVVTKMEGLGVAEEGSQPKSDLETDLSLLSRKINANGDEVMLMATILPPAGNILSIGTLESQRY